LIENTLIEQNIGSYRGGGIYNGGHLTVTNSTIRQNDETGITSQGFLTVTLSVISDNQGSGLYNAVYYSTSATAVVMDSHISGNTGYDNSGGGIYNGRAGTLTVIGSTIHNNTAQNVGGGIYIGGAPPTGALTTIINSTISNNHVLHNTMGYGGGIISGGTLTLQNVTLTGNTASNGAGLYNSGPATLLNTVIANNTGGTNCADILNQMTSQGNNLASDHSCNLAAPGDQPGVDPLLAPLANNGGPTFTHALLPGSPAIDTGSLTTCPTTDQRGLPRPLDGNGDTTPICDIGAYEHNPTTSP
jgi:hypothetical protein